MVSMEELLNTMVQRGGSDLHLSVGSRPKIRIDGKLEDSEYDLLSPEITKKLVYSVLSADQIATFLAAANPANWKVDDLKAMLHQHLDLTTREVTAYLNKDWKGSIDSYDKVRDQASPWPMR